MREFVILYHALVTIYCDDASGGTLAWSAGGLEIAGGATLANGGTLDVQLDGTLAAGRDERVTW